MKPKPRGSKSPEDFSLGESSPVGVGRGRAAVSQRWVKVFLWSRFLFILFLLLLILLHLQPAGSTRRQPEIQSHRVSSVRVPASLLLLVGSVLAGGRWTRLSCGRLRFGGVHLRRRGEAFPFASSDQVIEICRHTTRRRGLKMEMDTRAR
ncbi:hypothetical protein EYF80_029343 [Liparis tanakae]|uniref:Uncharacterized protein n=1 Tax=Liparis tanakae TaxID=230148 RepID=A0A4Z2H6I7_9TELE|nr:hypothetical protein EYF80_029343 [Liparis tanakae]